MSRLHRAKRSLLSTRRPLGLTAMVALSLTVGGCGFVLTNGPPPNHAALPQFSCTENKIGPVLDLVYAGANAIAAIALVTAEAEEGTGAVGDFAETVADRAAIYGAALAISFGISGFVGLDKVGRCRAARDALAARRESQPVEVVRLRPVLPIVPAAQLNQPLPLRLKPLLR